MQENREAFWTELERIKTEYADRNLAYYRKRSPRVRVLFRGLGILLVASTVCAPLILLWEGPGREAAMAVATFAVALLAGLNGFFQCQALWQKYCSMEVFIEHAVATWSVQMAEARYRDDRRAAKRATRMLVDSIGHAMSSETVRFFGRIRLQEGAMATREENGRLGSRSRESSPAPA